jgi:hypothetical protein
MDTVSGNIQPGSSRINWAVENLYKQSKELRAASDAREAQMAARRQEVQNRQTEVAAKWSAFAKAHNVSQYVTASQLNANPFAFKGQVVAVWGFFERMDTETQATFHMGDSFFTVSGVSSKLTQRGGAAFLLAGRVTGRSSNGQPHLSYVGVAVCQDSGCRDYISNR